MADYPDAIYSPRTMANRPGVNYDDTKTTIVFAEDFNLDRAELVAVQETLGTNPEGTYTTVGDRLDDIEDTLLGAQNYKFQAYFETDKSISNEIGTTLDFDATEFDLGSDFDVDTGEYTVPATGYYYFTVSFLLLSPTDNAPLQVSIRNDGTNIIRRDFQSSGTFTMNGNCSGLVYCEAGDVITSYVWFSMDGSKTLPSGSANSSFSGFRVL